ncbi:MAG: hypothetical protein WDA27_06750 [Actinomycetota bacterium]
MLLAVAGVLPTELLARAMPYVVSTWSLRVQEHESGAVLTTLGDVDECDGWLAVGRSAADPWGNPSDVGGRDSLSRDLSRYGLAALHMAAGPVVAFDGRAAVVARAPNGIVPVWVSGVAAGTLRCVVEACGGGPARMLKPGHSVSIATGASGASHASEVFDGPKLFSLRDVQRELAESTRHGDPVAGPGNSDGALREGLVAGTWVYAPDVTKGRWRIDRAGSLSHVRESVLPELWARARAAGRWLFAPVTEAPAVELLSYVGEAT